MRKISYTLRRNPGQSGAELYGPSGFIRTFYLGHIPDAILACISCDGREPIDVIKEVIETGAERLVDYDSSGLDRFKGLCDMPR